MSHNPRHCMFTGRASGLFWCAHGAALTLDWGINYVVCEKTLLFSAQFQSVSLDLMLACSICWHAACSISSCSNPSCCCYTDVIAMLSKAKCVKPKQHACWTHTWEPSLFKSVPVTVMLVTESVELPWLQASAEWVNRFFQAISLCRKPQWCIKLPSLLKNNQDLIWLVLST